MADYSNGVNFAAISRKGRRPKLLTRPLTGSQVGLALMAACMPLAACNKKAAQGDPMANASPASPASNTLTIDTLAKGANGLSASSQVTAKHLPAAAPGTADAALDVLHRAVAYIQTGRTSELQPLLSSTAKAQLTKAGGDALLRQYRSGRIEFADGAAINEAHTTVTTRFRLHLPEDKPMQARVGEAILRRSATAWLIDSVTLAKAR